jgi:hypothetical protein
MVITLASQAKDDGSIPFARSTFPFFRFEIVSLLIHRLMGPAAARAIDFDF